MQMDSSSQLTRSQEKSSFSIAHEPFPRLQRQGSDMR